MTAVSDQNVHMSCYFPHGYGCVVMHSSSRCVSPHQGPTQEMQVYPSRRWQLHRQVLSISKLQFVCSLAFSPTTLQTELAQNEARNEARSRHCQEVCDRTDTCTRRE